MSVVEAAYSGPWPLVEVGRVMKRVSEEGYPGLEPLSVFLEAGVVPRSSRSDNHNQLGADLSKYQRVLPGDLVFNKLRTWQGGFGASRHEGIVSPAYIILRPASEGMDARFVDYVLHSTGHLAELTRVSKFMPPSQFDIIWEDLRAVQIPLPPMEVQRRIADFLDDQTARIDHIITARQQQVMHIRAAVQSMHAARTATVLSASPTTRLARFFRRIEQGDSPPGEDRSAQPGEKSVLKTSAVKDGVFDPTQVKVLYEPETFRSSFAVDDGDVIVVRGSGSADLVADAAVVRLGDAKELMLSDLTYRLSDLRLDPRFTVAYLLAPQVRSEIRLSVRQGSGPAKVRGEDIGNLSVPVISSADQRRYAGGFWGDRESTAEATALLLGSIDVLQDLKRSLISAAVSGDFDVSSADGSRVVV